MSAWVSRVKNFGLQGGFRIGSFGVYFRFFTIPALQRFGVELTRYRKMEEKR